MYTRTHSDREDLFQEIVARLWSAFPRYDPSRPFTTWLYRVALNVAIDAERKRRRRREAPTSDLTSVNAPDASSRHDARDHQLSLLRRLIDQHAEPDRVLLFLHLEGAQHKQIGEVLGISESNVGTRLSRLRAALRDAAARLEHDPKETP